MRPPFFKIRCAAAVRVVCRISFTGFRSRSIDGNNFGAGVAESDGACAGACGEIEDALAWLWRHGANGRNSPEVGVARGEDRVGAVVVLCDAVEHAGNLIRLLAQVRLAHVFQCTEKDFRLTWRTTVVT